MKPDKKIIETGIDSSIDEIIERSNIQNRILKKFLSELSNRTKLPESEEVKSAGKNMK